MQIPDVVLIEVGRLALELALKTRQLNESQVRIAQLEESVRALEAAMSRDEGEPV